MRLKSTLITTLLIGSLSTGAMAEGNDIEYLEGFFDRMDARAYDNLLIKMNTFSQLEKEADMIWTLETLNQDRSLYALDELEEFIVSNEGSLNSPLLNNLHNVFNYYDRSIELRRNIMHGLLDVYEINGRFSIKDDRCKDILVDNYLYKYNERTHNVVDVFKDIDDINECFVDD